MYVAMAPAPSQPRWRMAHSQWESLAAATDQWWWRDWEMAEPSGDYENVCGCCWDSVINGEYWIKSWLIAPVECQERLLMELWTDWAGERCQDLSLVSSQTECPGPSLDSLLWGQDYWVCHENMVITGRERSRAVRRSWTGSSSQGDGETVLCLGQTFWQLHRFMYKYILWRMFSTLFLNWNIKQNVPTDHIWYLLRRVDSSQAESEDDNIIRKSSLPETRETWEDPFTRLRIMRNSSRYKSKWWDSSPLSISWSPPIPPQSGKIVSSFDCLCEPRAGHVLERKELIRTCFRH